MVTNTTISPSHHHSDTARLARMSKGLRLVRFLPLLVLAVSLIVTHQLWQDARQNAMQDLQADFDSRVHEAKTQVERRMATYEQVMRGVRGLFAASISVERDEFHEYASALRLEENYPGIRGIGFALIVPPQQKQRHIDAIRKQGFPDYNIHPEGAREIYTSVIYIEPFDERNRRAFGYDMYSDLEHPRDGDTAPGVRRAAMERARDSGRAAISGKAVISGKVRLLMEMETDKQVQAGFLMYLPIYRNGASLDTLAEHRANIVGWVYAPFRMDDLMNSMLDVHTAGLDIEIYDGDELSDRTLMHDPSRHDAGISPLFRTARSLDIVGHKWTMAIHSLPGFEMRLDREKPQIVVNTAISVSLLLTLLAWLLVRDQQRTLQTAKYLAENEARLREMFENLNSGVAIYHASPDGRDFTITAFNPAAERIEKIGSAEVIGRNVTEVFPGIAETGLLEALRRVWKSGAAEHFPASFYQDERISGWRENYVFKLSSGEMVAIYDDVTERKLQEDQTQYQAHYDALTHLPNRTLMTDRIRQALAKAKRDKSRLALMFVDLDKFKPVNDELGHDIGDLLLKEVARRLQDCMRESDTAARTGGDEFLVLLPTIDAENIEAEQDAMLVAEKICHAISQPYELAGHRLDISCSIGVAVYPEHGSDEEQLLKHADMAMYHAKGDGRNNVKIFHAGMRAKS
ncbi:MAG: CHASE domain-containing protein [Gallionella sp.]|nr:CHASE domain-containing protein [Gallionella sp.]